MPQLRTGRAEKNAKRPRIGRVWSTNGMTITHQPATQVPGIRQRRPGGRVVERRPVARKPVLVRLGLLVLATACVIGVVSTFAIAAVMVLAGSLAR
jgi:hypothetical protein